MYTVDLLAAIERKLGWEPAIETSIAERENAILAEIERLRQGKPKRIPAGDMGHVNKVTRQVTSAIMAGESARVVAERFGVSEYQARAACNQQIDFAVRKALEKIRQRDPKMTDWEVPILQFVASATAKGGQLRRAQDNRALVELKLAEMWKDQDEMSLKGQMK